MMKNLNSNIYLPVTPGKSRGYFGLNSNLNELRPFTGFPLWASVATKLNHDINSNKVISKEPKRLDAIQVRPTLNSTPFSGDAQFFCQWSSLQSENGEMNMLGYNRTWNTISANSREEILQSLPASDLMGLTKQLIQNTFPKTLFSNLMDDHPETIIKELVQLHLKSASSLRISGYTTQDQMMIFHLRPHPESGLVSDALSTEDAWNYSMDADVFRQLVVALIELAEDVFHCSQLMICVPRKDTTCIKALRYVGFELVASHVLNHDAAQYALMAFQL